MIARSSHAIEPEEILGELLELDPDLRRERYYGERAIFYNPGGAAPLGVLTRLDELMPHPVYAWMSWVQVLAPTPARYEALRPLLAESLELARARWRRRRVT